jgi:signal transduction histidine kinase
VLTSTSLLEEYAKTGQEEKMKKHFMRIKSSVKELTNILEDFLSLEKIESGKIQIVKKEINLPIFIKAILDELSYLLKKGQQIKYKHVGAELIKEDSKILKHILQNLISNASKFSGEDQIILLDTKVAENKIFIKIEDNGIGIPELEQKNLFSHFFRAKNAENIQGTGLGLNIVKRYVELLNGNIDFKSEEHRGATFLMDIPTNAVSQNQTP